MNKTMTFTPMLQKAVDFAIKIHETDTKKKRKGKDVPYITHPLTVGIILARVTADEDVIAAGILHDTIEDCSPEASVTMELLAQEFNQNVADLVWAVTEKDVSLPWHERKQAALTHIKHMTHDQILIKSADVLHNLAELLEDIAKDGLIIFQKFDVGEVAIIRRYQLLDQEFAKSWIDNPLYPELHTQVQQLTLQSSVVGGEIIGLK